MSESKRLEQGRNNVTVVGAVSEYNLVISERKMKITDEDGTEREIVSALMYGTLVVDSSGATIKHNILTSKHRANGEISNIFDNLCKAFNIVCGYDENKSQATYDFSEPGISPKINGKLTVKRLKKGEEETNVKGAADPTVIRTKGYLSRNLFLNKDKNDLIVGKQISIQGIDKNIEGDDSATFTIAGYAYEVLPRVDTNGNETGELDVKFIVPNYRDIDVFTFRVPKEWTADGETFSSEDFLQFIDSTESENENEMNMINLIGDIENVSYGSVPRANKVAFGKKSNVAPAFNRVEWHIKGGSLSEDNIVETVDDITNAMKEYSVFLDAEFDRIKERTNNSNDAGDEEEKPISKGMGKKSKISAKDLPF